MLNSLAVEANPKPGFVPTIATQPQERPTNPADGVRPTRRELAKLSGDSSLTFAKLLSAATQAPHLGGRPLAVEKPQANFAEEHETMEAPRNSPGADPAEQGYGEQQQLSSATPAALDLSVMPQTPVASPSSQEGLPNSGEKSDSNAAANTVSLSPWNSAVVLLAMAGKESANSWEASCITEPEHQEVTKRTNTVLPTVESTSLAGVTSSNGQDQGVIAQAPISTAESTSVSATPLEQLVRQTIAEGEIVRRDGQTHLYVRLEPPELGSVRVHLTASHDSVTARFTVDQADARQLLEIRGDGLRHALANAGISLSSFDVSGGDHGSAGQEHHEQFEPRDGGQLAGSLSASSAETPPALSLLTYNRVDVII